MSEVAGPVYGGAAPAYECVIDAALAAAALPVPLVHAAKAGDLATGSCVCSR